MILNQPKLEGNTMYNIYIINFQRIVASILFLFHLIGWFIYPYPIDKSYSSYSLLLMFAFLIGAMFSKNLYKSRLGLVSVCVYTVAILFTIYYAISEAREGSKAALQSMSLRIFDIALFSSLTFVALSGRRKPDR